MTVTTLNLNNALPIGITLDFETPCKGTVFTDEVLEDLFSSQLPKYLESFRDKWNTIPMGQVSGLAPPNHGGAIDLCNGENGFDVDRHAGASL